MIDKPQIEVWQQYVYDKGLPIDFAAKVWQEWERQSQRPQSQKTGSEVMAAVAKTCRLEDAGWYEQADGMWLNIDKKALTRCEF